VTQSTSHRRPLSPTALGRLGGLVLTVVGFALVATAPAAVAVAQENEPSAEAADAEETGAGEADHGGEAEHADGDADDEGAAHGGEGDHDAPPLLSLDIGSAFWNLVIFLLVLAVLAKFVWPNVLGGLQAREEKIRSDLEGAEKAHEKAQSLLAEYQSKLDEASAQVQTMLSDARKDAEANGQRILDEAKQQAQRERERALADIETAKKVAMADIADQTTELAMQVARSVVGRELKPEDHADLIRQSLDRLPSKN